MNETRNKNIFTIDDRNLATDLHEAFYKNNNTTEVQNDKHTYKSPNKFDRDQKKEEFPNKLARISQFEYLIQIYKTIFL